MQTLDSLLGLMEEEEPLETFSVDVSSFFGQEAETTRFSYREPDIARTFQIPIDAQKLALRPECAEWPENLRLTVAMLAQGHVAPNTKEVPVALFYVQMAKRRKRLLTYLSSVFNSHFPHLMGSKEAFEEEKKSSGEREDTSSDSASSTQDASPAN